MLWIGALALVVAGCGHKGPLVLPKAKPGVQKPAAQKPVPAAAEPDGKQSEQ